MNFFAKDINFRNFDNYIGLSLGLFAIFKSMGIATDLILIVLAGLLGGLIAHLFKQPLLLGYILGGIIVGPYTGGVTVQNIHDIEMLAEIGVALLLFTLGLEFSFKELKRLSAITFIVTPLQILLSTLTGFLVASAVGLSKIDAIWIGAAISLSSTMVVLKTLTSLDSLGTRAGRLMIAMLIAQDLAVVPMMLLLPQISSASIDYGMIAAALLKSLLFLIFMFFAGTKVLPRLFALMARQGSPELFFLSTLAVALGAGFISHELGLSFALGALISGMLLSQTDFNHQALSDVSNLRDLFSLIFFVSVGMLFDPSFFIGNIRIILIIVLTILTSKALITGCLIRLFGYSSSVAWRSGLGISQVGEFAFVVVNAGYRFGHLSKDSYSLMIAVAVVSMLLTPTLFRLGEFVSKINKKYFIPTAAENEQVNFSEHVVIIGAGVVGRYVARVLSTLQRSHVIIESDHRIVTELRDSKMPVIFGDASRRIILEAANLNKANLVVITTTKDDLLPLLTAEIRKINENIPIVVRVEEVDEVKELAELKVSEIVQPQFEVGLEMIRQSLLALKIEEVQIFTLLGQLRAERYEPDQKVIDFTTQELRLLGLTKFLDFIWFEVDQQVELLNCSLAQTRLRERFNVSVVAVLRAGSFIPTPTASFQIEAGDVLGILGTKTRVQIFKAEIK